MRLGYACINTGLPTASRTVRLANATPERLHELIEANLDALEDILRWNAEHEVRVFRLTSGLIPFGSHPVNTLPWWRDFAGRFEQLGSLLASSAARVSVHPGQYTVLSSEQPLVVSRAIAELDCQAQVLTSLALDTSHKIVLHVGAGAAEPSAAATRFAAGLARLSDDARARLVVEHDERWTLERVLELAAPLDLPVVFDAFHHTLAPSFEGQPVREMARRAGDTWRPSDGRQEVHFSTQEPGKRPGAHARTLDLGAFATFAEEVGDLPLDCILEVKDKEQSLLRARAVLERRTHDAGVG